MNNITLLLTVGFVANILLIAGLAILVIFLHKDNIENLKASHSVLYAKQCTIQDSLKLLLKNLDIEEEEKKEPKVTIITIGDKK